MVSGAALNPTRVLVIGLDGMTFDILEPLMKQGRLPVLSAFRARSAWAELASTIPPFTIPAWATFASGMNPGWHGILSFQAQRADGSSQFVDATQLPDSLWAMVSRAGKQVGVVNVPLTFPPPAVNGIVVSGMLTPPSADAFTYPPQLAGELEDYVIDLDGLVENGRFRQEARRDREQMLAQVQHMLERRAANCLRLMARHRWDFFITFLTCTDRVAHFFWDEVHALGSGQAADFQAELAHFYSSLDQAIGQLIEAAPHDAFVLIVSDHGFGPAAHHYVNLNVWLEQQGLLRVRSGLREQFRPQHLRRSLGRHAPLKALLRRLLPFGLQGKLRQAIASPGEGNLIDWQTTQASMVPLYTYTCGIKLQAPGGGELEPAQREGLCRRLAESLPAICDPANGQAVVRAVYRREEIYHGPHLRSVPDVIVVLHPDYTAMSSLADRSVVKTATYRLRSGDHRQEGILMARGPGISPAHLAGQPSLADMAPTILHLLGIPPGRQFDGRVLTEMFTPGWLAEHPLLAVQASEQAPGQAGYVYTAEEQAALQQRLESLGYL